MPGFLMIQWEVTESARTSTEKGDDAHGLSMTTSTKSKVGSTM